MSSRRVGSIGKRSHVVKARPSAAFAATLTAKAGVKRRRSPKQDAGALVRARAEAEAATQQAREAHARLRDAIDILPQGIVFLDSEGRYILWNQQYADIYKRSADLFQPGARLEDTLRIGVARGDYPEAIGREEEWIAERLDQLLNPRGRHEQHLSDGRCVLIEERRTTRRRHHRAARRHHRDEAARGLVPPAVRRQSGADVRLRAATTSASSPSTTPRSTTTAMTARRSCR